MGAKSRGNSQFYKSHYFELKLPFCLLTGVENAQESDTTMLNGYSNACTHQKSPCFLYLRPLVKRN